MGRQSLALVFHVGHTKTLHQSHRSSSVATIFHLQPDDPQSLRRPPDPDHHLRNTILLPPTQRDKISLSYNTTLNNRRRPRGVKHSIRLTPF